MNISSRSLRQWIALPMLGIMLLWSSPILAQKKKSSDAPSASSTVSPLLYNKMEWRNIGPHRGGRSLAVAGHRKQPYTYYFGATGGGVWKTNDGGANWFNVSDKFFKQSSVGALAVAESDPNVLYCGMGETDIRGNITMGDGIYKSTDAGETWKHLGLAETQSIGTIAIHPQNADVVYAAAMGHVFGRNKERGLYRSTDGGQTWKQILYKDDKTGCVHVVLDPTNPRIVYAVMWEAYRAPHEMSSGGPGSGLWKSTDGGDTWTELTRNPGMPKGVIGKIGITVSPMNSNLLFAMVENDNGGVFRSDDAGKTWTRTTDDRNLRQRAWYYSHIYADPKSENTVYVLNVNMLKSIDGGRTFRPMNVQHGDTHDLWIDPDNSQRMILGDDGGAEVTYNGGITWTEESFPTSQFYHVTVDNQFPYMVYGAQQDNTSVAIASRTTSNGITVRDWFPAAGGESGYIVAHPSKPHLIFGGEYGGLLTKLDTRTKQNQEVSVWPDNPIGAASKDRKYRFQWTYPIVFSPHDANTLYVTSQFVHRSNDEGMSWEIISPDLTRNQKDKQEASGGPITKDNTGVEVYNTIFTFAESSVEQGVLWTGSDCGLIHVSRDNGKSWANVTPKELNDLGYGLVSMIDASPFDKGTCYAAVNRYKVDDHAVYIFRTTDYGKTWTKIGNGIPQGHYVRVVREDPNKRGLLYAGTEHGVYVSFNGGEQWQSLQLNLPITPIHDLVIQKREKDIVVATHGRAFWILDDVTPLHHIADDIAKTDIDIFSDNVYLYAPRQTYRMEGGTSFSMRGGKVGQNAPNGVVVQYYLKNKPQGEVKVEFLTADNKVINSFSSMKDRRGKPLVEQKDFYANTDAPRRNVSPTTDSGMNRFVWNMRYSDVTEVPGALLWGGSLDGPRITPGRYKVRLTVDIGEINIGDKKNEQGEKFVSEVQEFEVLKDPRLSTTQAEFNEQLQLHLAINAKADTVHKTINAIRAMRTNIQSAQTRAGDKSGDAFKKVTKPLLDSLNSIENELIQTKIRSSQDMLNYPIKINNKLLAVANTVESADTRPTKASYDVFKELGGQADAVIARLKPIVSRMLPAINAFIAENKLGELSGE